MHPSHPPALSQWYPPPSLSSCATFDHLFFMGDLNYRLGPPELGDEATKRDDAVRYWQVMRR